MRDKKRKMKNKKLKLKLNFLFFKIVSKYKKEENY